MVILVQYMRKILTSGRDVFIILKANSSPCVLVLLVSHNNFVNRMA